MVEENQNVENPPEAIPSDYKCECELPLKSMEDWIKGEEKDGECRPCTLGPVTQWYVDVLKENGHPDKATEIEQMVKDDSLEPLTLCQKLDTIKEEVEPSIRERLKDFDCSAQSFSEQEV